MYVQAVPRSDWEGMSLLLRVRIERGLAQWMRCSLRDVYIDRKGKERERVPLPDRPMQPLGYTVGIENPSTPTLSTATQKANPALHGRPDRYGIDFKHEWMSRAGEERHRRWSLRLNGKDHSGIWWRSIDYAYGHR